ncbi:MAG: hypothetical protein ACRDY2_06895 [Acidimicrobiales bacterium]
MTMECDRCRAAADGRTRRANAWAWAVPGGMGLAAAGFVGAVVTIGLYDEAGVIASVVVLAVGGLVACLGAMYGTIDRPLVVGRHVGEVDPGDGGGTWTPPAPAWTPPSVGEQPSSSGPASPGSGVGEDPAWWPAFEPVLAGWLREGASEETR